MIARLRGILLTKKPPDLTIEVAGVGYEIKAPLNIFYKLPDIGGEISLYTHLLVREDAHTLYGFLQEQERQLFRELLRVTGVGPKLALTILSSIEPNDFGAIISCKDGASLARLPGVGKKTADRLIMEMKDRLVDFKYAIESATASKLLADDSAIGDAMQALVTLGYKPQEARKAVLQVKDQGKRCEDLIRLALQKMV